MEANENVQAKWKEILLKYLPYIFVGFVVLCIGLSMIGPFFEIRLKEDGQKIDTIYRLTDLLFSHPAGGIVQIFFIFNYLVLPLVGCACILLARFHKNFYVVSVLLFILVGITSILSNEIFAEALVYKTDLDYSTHGVGFCCVLSIVTFFIAGLASLAIASSKVKISVEDLTEMGVLVGLALVLNFIKVPIGDTGGSINFQMLPLFILALRKGPLKGFVGAGIAYGLISCITDGYGIATYPFDYLLAFGSTCILGFFTPYIFGENQETYNFKGELFLFVGALLATIFRFIGGCASSMIIYGYSLTAAMAYNAIYVSVSSAISIAVIMGIYGPFIKVNKRFPSAN